MMTRMRPHFRLGTGVFEGDLIILEPWHMACLNPTVGKQILTVMRTRFEPSVLLCARRRCSGKAVAGARAAGFTLVEVVMSTAIVALVFGGIITAYIQSGMRVQWSGYSLAAQSLATSILEQAKSGVWDPAQAVPINNLTNLNLLGTSYNATTQTYTGYSTAILDVPYSNTNYTVATNYVTVQLLYVSGVTNVQMQFVRVDSVWPFQLRKANLYFTNTVCTMVAPDNRG